MRERIGIFGGSFDPVHMGHKKLAQFMCARLELSRMLIIPAGMSPFKNSSGASAEQRLKMCSLCFSEEIFRVSDIEIRRSGKSYTVDTVRAIRELYPDAELYLIIGSDQLLSFDRWYRFEEILENVTLCAVSRSEGVKTQELRDFAEERLSAHGRCLIFEFEPFEVSSTGIRLMIKENGECAYMDSKVLEYIFSEGLYKDE